MTPFNGAISCSEMRNDMSFESNREFLYWEVSYLDISSSFWVSNPVKRAIRLSRFSILQQERLVHFHILSENIKGANTDQSVSAKS